MYDNELVAETAEALGLSPSDFSPITRDDYLNLAGFDLIHAIPVVTISEV